MAQVEKPLVAWSHSALEVYRTCPRKYYESKITKAWVEEFKGPAADWGLAVHRAFEQRIRYGSPFPSNMSQWEPLAVKLEAMSGAKRTELQLCLNQALQPVDWFAKDAWCRTIIDLLVLRGPKAMVWDYKTGRRKDDDRQLALMAAVVFEYHPEVDTVIAGYLWLKDGVSMSKATFVREHKGRLWNQYLPTVEMVENSVMTGNWPEKPSGLCNGWCPVQDCKHWAPKQEK